jgi:hypothetical protein
MKNLLALAVCLFVISAVVGCNGASPAPTPAPAATPATPPPANG